MPTVGAVSIATGGQRSNTGAALGPSFILASVIKLSEIGGKLAGAVDDDAVVGFSGPSEMR